MAKDEEKGFFDKWGEILNAPLPGTQGPASKQTQSSPQDDDDEPLLGRVKDILNTQLPGTRETATPETDTGTDAGQPGQAGMEAAPQQQEKTPELDEDDLDEAWWKQDWAAFRAHQEQERNGLELKQRGDQEKFSAYQQQEKQRFAGYQQQELSAFVHMQSWRLAAWKQALAGSPPGHKPPPPPRNMPPGSPMSGPGGGQPPWLRPPGMARRRS